jgi:hypothetical protein
MLRAMVRRTLFAILWFFGAWTTVALLAYALGSTPALAPLAAVLAAGVVYRYAPIWFPTRN